MHHPTLGILFQIDVAEKAILLRHLRGHGGRREADSARRGGSIQLLSPIGAGTCVFQAWRGQARQGTKAKALRVGCCPRSAAEMERILEKSKGRNGTRFAKARALFWLVKSLHRAHRERYSLVLRRSQSVTIFVGSTASLSICISTTLPLLSIR